MELALQGERKIEKDWSGFGLKRINSVLKIHTSEHPGVSQSPLCWPALAGEDLQLGCPL